MSEYGMSE
ncbi:hypothetical protein LINPERPRIM_LOCUS38049 [Linum perenne]